MKTRFACKLSLLMLLAGCNGDGAGQVVIHSDSVCRADPLTDRVYIIERLNSDAVLVLDCSGSGSRALVITSDYATGSFVVLDDDLNRVADACQVTGEYSVGPGTNPQDIAVVAPDRAYLPRLQDAGMLVVHPVQGTELDAVDLSGYADPDGVPEAAWAVVQGGKVYLALQRLTNFEPGDYSSVLVIDGPTGQVEDELILGGTSPFAKPRYSAALDRIVLGETGLFGELDGGVEYLNPADNSLSGFQVSELALEGDIADVVVASAAKGYAVVSVTQPDFSRATSVVSFDPLSGEKLSVLATGEGFDHSFFELTPDGSRLWVTDRRMDSPGIRVFDTATDQEITSEPVDTGLPPFMVCFF